MWLDYVSKSSSFTTTRVSSRWRVEASNCCHSEHLPCVVLAVSYFVFCEEVVGCVWGCSVVFLPVWLPSHPHCPIEGPPPAPAGPDVWRGLVEAHLWINLNRAPWLSVPLGPLSWWNSDLVGEGSRFRPTAEAPDETLVVSYPHPQATVFPALPKAQPLAFLLILKPVLILLMRFSVVCFSQ